jgi:N-acyl-D-amino-acid deacylase
MTTTDPRPDQHFGAATRRVLVFENGRVYTGFGDEPVVADVVVVDGVVREVGPGAARAASSFPESDVDRIDATAKDVLPGFIDVHSHDDAALFRPGGVVPKINQGVTTTIVGNCGQGCAPSSRSSALEEYSTPVLGAFPTDKFWPTFGDYVADLASTDLGIEAVALVPHAPVRASVLGMDRRPASAPEINAIAALMGDALDAGALGVSLGLMYSPGDAANGAELVAIAAEVARRDKILVAHVRNEADFLTESVNELADLARATGAKIHISHLKVTGPRNLGTMPRVIDHLDALRTDGIDVTADIYPYDAGSTTVTSLFPPSTAGRGVESLLEALRDPAERRAIIDGLEHPWVGTALENQFAAVGPTRILLTGFRGEGNHRFEGRSIADIAAELGVDARIALVELVLAEQGMLTVIVFHTDINGMLTALAWPHTLVGSDGLPREGGTVHPRLFGTFSRLLDRYTGANAPLTRAEGIRRMTTAASDRFGILHSVPGAGARSGAGIGTAARGSGIHPGHLANLQLIDPTRYADRASYDSPRRSPDGLDGVWLAGRRIA